MTYSVALVPAAAKAFSKVDRQSRMRVVGAIELLAIEPRPPGATMLRGGERGLWRVRVGDFQVVYSIDDGRVTVWVLRVAHRREVYQR